MRLDSIGKITIFLVRKNDISSHRHFGEDKPGKKILNNYKLVALLVKSKLLLLRGIRLDSSSVLRVWKSVKFFC